ncbi:MAG: sulfatase, partial [Chitinophagaceae bacterium]|nr:sulfatase [Chitinophagaceae bacterium]
DNAFANALESNKGLPAILASLPEVMDEPVYASNYNNNRFRGIGHLLKEKGYNTSFFLGAEYDHFGFARLCKMVGIDKYYSADTYDGKDEHHDGSWGIYDEYFFPYFAREVSKKQQPFFSVLFNISSHYPYKMPDATAARIKVPGQRPQQDGATYVDHCFGRLFYQIRSQPWFSNTLFVFVADHGFRYTTASNEILREIRIPLFVYDPRDTTGRRVQSVVRQLDIVPSILDKLGYSEPFTSFGSSFYREGPGFSVNKIFGVHQFVDSVSLVGYSVEQNQALYYYDYRPDSLLKNNLLQVRRTEIPGKLDRLKAFHQQAVNRLIDNRLDK